MRDLTVLVSACGYQFMPALADCIKDNGERNISIVGTDMNYDETILQMVDAFYQVPKALDPNYIPRVLEICDKEKVDIILPTMSAELIPIIDNITTGTIENNLNTNILLPNIIDIILNII